MSLFSSRKREQLTSPPKPASEPLWRKNDFLAYAVGTDSHAVLVRGTTPQVFPGFVVDFVSSCGKFAPLEQHLASYADKHFWGRLEVESLRSWLPRAKEARLLVSTSEVLSAARKGVAAAAEVKISTLGFPTGGDRADLVERAIRSFAGNLRRHGREGTFLIADSSEAEVHRARFREAGRAWAAELGMPILYAGESEKLALTEKLVGAGLPRSAVEFALLDPLGIGFACGANRNALLLHEIGRPFCSIDDDVVCALSPAPSTDARLKLFSSCDPFTRWLFGSREGEVPEIDADFLGEHERLLGRGLPEISSQLSEQECDFSQAGDDFLRRLWGASPRVRASFYGHRGDPGIPTSVYYLWYEGENRRRLTESEDLYREALISRNVFSLAPTTAIGDASTSPGMAMGLDHTDLLPPFFPVLHAEDFTYGATLWQTCTDALLGHIPLAIRHEPRPGKTILSPDQLNHDRRAVIFEFSHLIRRVILRFQRFESAAPAERMRQLGIYLRGIGDQPIRDFVDFIQAQVLEHESGKLDYLADQLRNDDESPEFWRHDMEAYLAHAQDALTCDDFDIPFDLKGDRSDEENRQLMRDLFRRYGELLEVWPDMVDATRQINAGSDWAIRL